MNQGMCIVTYEDGRIEAVKVRTHHSFESYISNEFCMKNCRFGIEMPGLDEIFNKTGHIEIPNIEEMLNNQDRRFIRMGKSVGDNDLGLPEIGEVLNRISNDYFDGPFYRARK